MIPAFNHSHVLPPYLGDTPVAVAAGSPYATSCTELVHRFANSVERINVLRGLFAYRKALADIVFMRGFQWLDGSFVENIEGREGRAPGDIDVFTFAYKPDGLDAPSVTTLMQANTHIFVPAQAKETYCCDAYVLPLDTAPENLVARTRYYTSLFSHRRGDQIWKGMLQLPLQSDDNEAILLLDALETNATDAADATQIGAPHVAAT